MGLGCPLLRGSSVRRLRRRAATVTKDERLNLPHMTEKKQNRKNKKETPRQSGTSQHVDLLFEIKELEKTIGPEKKIEP